MLLNLLKSLLAILLLIPLTVAPSLLSPSEVHSNNEVSCLAQIIYKEARGEPYLGKLAVASVAINRTKTGTFPNTICEVMRQPGQFTWYAATQSFKFNLESLHIATNMVYDNLSLKGFDALYFHAKRVNPSWGFKKVVTIGNHIFYKP